MKTQSKFITTAILFIITIIAGCSDEITSAGERKATTEQTTGIAPAPEKKLSQNSIFKAKIRLKPFKTYKFDDSTTPFIKFNAADVEFIFDPAGDKLRQNCGNIALYVTNMREDMVVGCHPRGLNTKEITIENLSSSFLDLEVSLIGVRATTLKEINSQ